MPKQLFGYDVIDQIGEGAHSQLYAVSDPATHQLYALKHVVREGDKEQRFIDQLQTEYDVGRQFTHPGLRKSIDLKANKTFLRKTLDAGLVMELFDGVPLHKQPPKSVGEVVEIFLQAARALDSLHYLRYIHCDIKPQNILTHTPGGGGAGVTVKIIDFGQASRAGATKERVQGTPDFIAPEQVELKPVTVRTDVFNFGATLYWALSGGRKIPTLFTVRKSKRHLLTDDEIPPLRQLKPELPEALTALVADCIRIEPMRRTKDMAVIAGRLEAIQKELAPPPAAAVETPAKAGRAVEDRPPRGGPATALDEFLGDIGK